MNRNVASTTFMITVSWVRSVWDKVMVVQLQYMFVIKALQPLLGNRPKLYSFLSLILCLHLQANMANYGNLQLKLRTVIFPSRGIQRSVRKQQRVRIIPNVCDDKANDDTMAVFTCSSTTLSLVKWMPLYSHN